MSETTKGQRGELVEALRNTGPREGEVRDLMDAAADLLEDGGRGREDTTQRARRLLSTTENDNG